MQTTSLPPVSPMPERIWAEDLKAFINNALRACAVGEDQADAVARALTEASLRGVDSHGARLLLHYAKVARTGRINAKAAFSIRRTGPATAILDADDGFGHWAGFGAIDEAIELAAATGLGAVSVINSSHFGAAGCYALRAAEAGYAGFAFANSDAFVLPHDGVKPFHGTNPIAFAAPVASERPFLLDMATSSIPWNKVQDLALKGLGLPADAAVDATGTPTGDPTASAALLPLGGMRYGYKGAGLASMLEIMSAVMTGMPHCGVLLGMTGPDLETPRHLGQFYIVIDPVRFVSKPIYDLGMASYLAGLRTIPGRDGNRVMAPGDREWQVERERVATGIPFAAPQREAFDALAAELKINPPAWA